MNSMCFSSVYRRKLFFAALSFTAIAIVFASCSPKHLLTPVTPDRHASQVIAAMHNAQPAFDFFASRFSGTANLDGSRMDIAGTLRIRNDSAIYISVAPILGIEIARILITPDNVKMLNRLEGTFFEGGMGIIANMLGADLDYFMLQSILLGKDMSHFSSDKFKVSVDHNMLLLHSPERVRQNPRPSINLEQTIWLDQHSYRIMQTTIFDKKTNSSIQAKYPTHSLVQGQSLPSEVMIAFRDGNSSADLSIRYSRISLDQPQQISFSVPERYRQMDF